MSAGQGSITVPGAIAATPVETPIDVEEGLQARLPIHAQALPQSCVCELAQRAKHDLGGRRLFGSCHGVEWDWPAGRPAAGVFLRGGVTLRKPRALPILRGAACGGAGSPGRGQPRGAPFLCQNMFTQKQSTGCRCGRLQVCYGRLKGFPDGLIVLTRMAATCMQAKSAGMIINTMGWIEGLGYELLLHSIQTLKVKMFCIFA